MQDSSPDASELTVTPEVTIGFVPIKSRDTYDEDRSVIIPLYLSPSREELLTELVMPVTSGDQGRWILAGVALLLNEDD